MRAVVLVFIAAVAALIAVLFHGKCSQAPSGAQKLEAGLSNPEIPLSIWMCLFVYKRVALYAFGDLKVLIHRTEEVECKLCTCS